MKMSFEWCKKKGMKLIEPTDNLAEEYFKNAEDTLKITNMIKDSGSNMWLATQKYYTEYLAAYSLLMKIGIKSEIHSCTIEVIKLLEQEKIMHFNLSKILEKDKELRIDNQYYLKNRPVKIDPKKLSQLLLNVRHILDTITKEQIEKIRSMI
ncbi:hypothetical protein COT48_00240 [Candidatus Woesearchaeota archaeon CG08_land_8_20_14_0_20_47_9]|nr:MAG: hypothetical protein COV22_04225 [Candidatus Woesearchaeota archaeon CG10_big_fil_rev_8_21_14_0_10_47_5]PIO04474.1 MAG: hypothetical protein COT48_00240 [Candidatus Woesearchaeota archaeon CG08_land_8_20_14_0_20_47_9]